MRLREKNQQQPREATFAETPTYGLRDAFDWLFNKLGGIQ
jgi:hypothetical protein